MHKRQIGKEQEVIPPRSQLYSLSPRGTGTVWVESLTSYIHRLASKYKVKPRALIAEALLPHLGLWYPSRPSLATHMGSFCRREAMGVNGTGAMATTWSETLSTLTMRSDLRELSVHLWATQLPTRGLLRWVPVWCPACYTAGRENGQALYHPLVWMLQVVTGCTRHRCWLREQCPHCQQRQSVIAARTFPGYCPQCTRWLGELSSSSTDQPITDEWFNWQEWVVHCVEELQETRAVFGALPWENLSRGLQVCREALGDARKLTARTNIPYSLFWTWSHDKQTPSFKRLLEFGYVLNVTPLQLLVSSAEALSMWILTQETYRQAHARESALAPINWEQIEHSLQDVLAGRKQASGVCFVAREVGISAKSLRKKFPLECAQITAQYHKDRAARAEQRVARQCREVRQATIALDEQGVKPSKQRVQALLSNAHMLRRPECWAPWHAVRHDLGLES